MRSILYKIVQNGLLRAPGINQTRRLQLECMGVSESSTISKEYFIASQISQDEDSDSVHHASPLNIDEFDDSVTIPRLSTDIKIAVPQSINDASPYGSTGKSENRVLKSEVRRLLEKAESIVCHPTRSIRSKAIAAS